MPRVAIIAAITLAGCLHSVLCNAESCHGPSAPSAFPEPATASDADILAAQQNVKKYLADMEGALKCYTATKDYSGYNQAVDDMQKIATTFNGVLRAYRTRQQKT